MALGCAPIRKILVGTRARAVLMEPVVEAALAAVPDRALEIRSNAEPEETESDCAASGT